MKSNRRFQRLVYATMSVGFFGCTHDATNPSAPIIVSTEGSARHIRSSGILFRLGSSDAQAASEERPGYTRFAHDFWLDTTEVTQAEYQSITTRNPSKVKGINLPVTDVSWYDAVVFANARSRHEGLDSVYEYSSALTDPSGNILSLSGLSIHLERSGWRLPTESEWEFAARAGSTTTYFWGNLSDSSKASEFSWYLKNSEASTHDVASRRANAWGLYDMSGNVMELVNDWKTRFPIDTLIDYSGLESPGEIQDIPLKGGSYNFDLAHLRPSERSATYASSRSSRCEYVGFRLARGFFSPTYTTSQGESIRIPPVTILGGDLIKEIGSNKIQLVFLNRTNETGILSWVDFSESNPVVRSLLDTLPIFHPAISPNGKWVVWSTVFEGSTAPSRIRARRLAKNDSTIIDLGEGVIPRWWLNGIDTFLIFSKSAADNSIQGWSSGQTQAQRWQNGKLVGAIETWANGSYHDGRSGNYLYSGYRRLQQYNFARNQNKVLFTYPQNGKSLGDTSQVCNVSASPDQSGRAMFLDFGFTGISNITGRPYGVHEFAFISDSMGNIEKHIESPDGESQWDHLEWSNSPNWAASAARNANDDYRNLYAINLGSEAVFKIASGEKLWQPYLWIENSGTSVLSGVDLDSAGAYRKKLSHLIKHPQGDAILSESSNKLSLFWTLRDSIQIAIVGNSRVGAGIIRSEFHSGSTFNWGISGTNTFGDAQIIQNYLLNAPNIKAVGLSIIPAWFLEWEGVDSWEAESNSIGFRYDQNHNFWRDSLPKNFLSASKKNASADSSTLQAIAGEWNLPSDGWGSPVPGLFPDDGAESAAAYFHSNLHIIRKIATELKRRGILFVMMIFPESPYYRNTPYAGMYGPTWGKYHEIIDSLRAIELNDENFHLYDAYKDGLNDYDSLDFSNESHLSQKGGRKFSRRLDSLISHWMR